MIHDTMVHACSWSIKKKDLAVLRVVIDSMVLITYNHVTTRINRLQLGETVSSRVYQAIKEEARRVLQC